MATESAQRSYRAPCPGCGAPVLFQSAQSTHAVCGYCRSTVVRSGETLSRIGKMAELFDDHSPLQLQASGFWGKQAFTLVGRLQYKYAEGTWTEWHAVLGDGSSAFLSEDNGAYVFGAPIEAGRDVAPAQSLRVGASTAIDGKTYLVASNQQVMLVSAQGELPHLPELGQSFAFVELRRQQSATDATAAGEVLSIDYGTQPPTLSVGATVLLEDLKLTGLRDDSGKDETARQFACPNCGAQVSVTLASSKSISCASCHSIIDLSRGIGAELQHALQDEPVRPLIALGSLGQLNGVNWQVVGFQHRMGVDPADPDEHFGWEEYLLYNRQRGFTFLVDSSDGWSVVKPTTDAPQMNANGQGATYQGQRYQLKESYSAETSYVAGEFYWQVRRGQKTDNRDFSSGRKLLSMERSTDELTWSAGSQIDSDVVAAAFKLEGKKDLLERSDVTPFSAAPAFGRGTIIALFVAIVLLLLITSRCSSCDPRTENCSASTGPRAAGGSYGGYSGGGGHK